MTQRLRLGVLFALLTIPMQAQFSAAVQGSVLDPSQAAVPHAKVSLTNGGTGITVETLTTSTGFYRLSSLESPGEVIRLTSFYPPVLNGWGIFSGFRLFDPTTPRSFGCWF